MDGENSGSLYQKYVTINSADVEDSKKFMTVEARSFIKTEESNGKTELRDTK